MTCPINKKYCKLKHIGCILYFGFHLKGKIQGVGMESQYLLNCGKNCPNSKDWFLTIRSIILTHDWEYLHLLKNNRSLFFIGPKHSPEFCIENKLTYGFLVGDSTINITSTCVVPIVFGSLFIAYWEAYPNEILNYSSWLEKNQKIESIIHCFICNYNQYALAPAISTCIVYGNFLKCPSFIVLDRRLPFSKKNVFHWYINSKLYKEPHEIFKFLSPIKEIFSDPNALHNKASYTIGRILSKLCENYLVAPKKHVKFSAKFYTKMNLELGSILRSGTLDVAISKTSRFCSSESHSNDHPTQISPGFTQASETSRIASIKGYHLVSTRWREPGSNSQLQVASIGLSAFKLISASVKTHNHQILSEDEIGFFSSEFTTDGQNSGRNIFFCPGVTFSNRRNAIKEGKTLISTLKQIFDYLINSEGIDPYFKGGNIVTSDGNVFKLNKWSTPRLDHAILSLTRDKGIPVSFYYDFDMCTGFIGSFTDKIQDAVTHLTPLTLRWLQTKCPVGISFFPVHRDVGPILSLIGRYIPFPNHTHGPKLTLGSSSLRHETGVLLPRNKFFRPYNQGYILYPGKSVCNSQTIPPITCLQLLVIFKCHGDNVEDGLCFSRSAIERGLGMSLQRQLATFEIEPEGEVAFAKLYPKNNLPQLIRPLERIASVCAVSSCKSFSILYTLSQVSQGSVDIYFTPAYESDLPINYYVIEFELKALENKKYKLSILIEYVQHLNQGDKITTLTGKGILCTIW